MFFIIFFFTYLLNMDLIKCQNTGIQRNVTITLAEIGLNCLVQPNFEFYEGDTLKIDFRNKIDRKQKLGKIYINHSYWTINNNLIVPQIPIHKKDFKYTITKNVTGKWAFKFTYLKNISFQWIEKYEKDGSDQYIYSVCTTQVNVVSRPIEPDLIIQGKWLIIFTIIVMIIVIIITAQTAAIMYYKTKANKSGLHNHLIRDGTDLPDENRYSTNPLKKAKKIEPPPNYRDSEILYEVPDIRGGLSAPPPIPNTPRPEHIVTLPKMTAAPSMITLRSNESTLPKQKPTDEDTLDRRPPLPLPHSCKANEFYSEADEENTYEPSPKPEKNVPKRTAPHIRFGKQLPTATLGPTGPVLPPLKPMKPPIPQAKPVPPRNNVPAKSPPVDKRLTKPHNAIQLSVRPIPGPSTLKKTTPKSKPPVPSPMTPTSPVQPKAKFFEKHQNKHDAESSDEEWTYEELPQFNIYSL